MEPSGGEWGLFGWHTVSHAFRSFFPPPPQDLPIPFQINSMTFYVYGFSKYCIFFSPFLLKVPSSAEEIVLTEGEYDAMSVYQVNFFGCNLSLIKQ